MLTPLTDPTKIDRAVRRMQRLLRGERMADVELRWQGGRAVVPLQWRAAELLWWHLGGKAAERWWFVLGHGPRPRADAVPGCEINLRKSGHDRRIAGALLRDSDGGLYLAHSGRIGGGHRGADKSAFRRFLVPGNWQTVRWPDDVTSELQVVADLGSPRFARQLGRFVREVNRFKSRAVDPRAPQAAPTPATTIGNVPLPLLCDEGLVLDALDGELRRRGIDRAGGDDANLFAHRFRGRRRIVELSVDASEAGVHRLLGRLLARSVESEPASRAIAVLPQTVPTWTAPTFRKLGVGLALFGWKGERPAFDGLDGALE